jgi:hypothetical protein
MMKNRKRLHSKLKRKMPQRALITLIALWLSVCFAAMAHADSYRLVNRTKQKLWVQHTSIKDFGQTSKTDSYYLEKGKTHTVGFGSNVYLNRLYIRISNKHNKDHLWKPSLKGAGLPKSWTVTVTMKNNKMEVKKTEN